MVKMKMRKMDRGCWLAGWVIVYGSDATESIYASKLATDGGG